MEPRAVPQPPAEGLRRRLKDTTRDLHQRLERLLPFFSPELDREAYQALLGRFLGFYAPLERRLVAHALHFPFAPADRARLIREDLVVLGRSPEQLDRLACCESIPEVSTLAQAAGCLYVLEGASLGGQLIARELERRFGFGARSGASFFAGDGEGTAARWRTFLDWLEALGREGGSDQVVAAAVETFSSFHRWLDHGHRR